MSNTLIRFGNPRRLGGPLWRSAVLTAKAAGANVLVVAPEDRDLEKEWEDIGVTGHWLTPQEAEAVGAALLSVSDTGEGGVVITSDPDSATLRAALLAEAAQRYDASAVRLLLDKAATRELAARAGVSTAPGLVWRPTAPAPTAAIRRLADDSPRGVVLKGALAWAGHEQARAGSGSEAVAAAAALAAKCGTHLVIEAFVPGIECSLELVRFADGSCRATGWSVKGRTDDERHPLYRPRIAPAGAPPAALVHAAQAVLREADYQGIADFDLICTDDGDIVVLECNPRTSWATLLHWTSRGYSSVECALAERDLSGDREPLLAAEFLLPDDERASRALASVAEADGWVHPAVEGLRSRGFVRARDIDGLAAVAGFLERTCGIPLTSHLDLAETALGLQSEFGDAPARRRAGAA
ncbi:ATP-grasp domain-containing protein [Streptacidiphilus anmyonensis]|uniref:ATP-grasp domain-containing protein n=1 Tax=Streptacidiphilus anmyonensis TaxID=405782 RepID=UPI00128B4EF4|nr:ATP-grasp domain-containing protein [Streptacidiphilus anmyonensis]